jgi:hypothetical protein
MSISKTFSVLNIYPFYNNWPLYPELKGNLRSSLSQVKRNDMQCVTITFIEDR